MIGSPEIEFPPERNVKSKREASAIERNKLKTAFCSRSLPTAVQTDDQKRTNEAEGKQTNRQLLHVNVDRMKCAVGRMRRRINSSEQQGHIQRNNSSNPNSTPVPSAFRRDELDERRRGLDDE